MKQVEKVKANKPGTGAISPAFLSPRMWSEDDAFLPPSTEVPHRPLLATRREQSDRTCFGLYVFVMVLFVIQGISAVLSANYQLPHEFQMCEDRLQQESIQVARNIPQAEINQHNIETAAQKAKHHSKLVDVQGHVVPTPHSSAKTVSGAEKRVGATVVKGGGRRLLGVQEAESSRDAEGEGWVLKEGGRVFKASRSEMLAELKQSSAASLPASQSTTLLNATQPDLTAPGTKTAEQRAKEVAKAKEKKKGEDGDVTEAEEQTLHVMISRMRSASGIVALLAVSSIVFGLIWVLLLANFTQPLVYLTLASLPVAFLSGGLLLILQGAPAGWVILGALLLCSLSALVFLWVKPSLPLTISLLHCASQALLHNSSAFFITVFLSVVQVLWLGCCVFFVVLEFISGEAVRVYPPPLPSGLPAPPRCEWQTDGWAYVGMGFIVVITLWTNNIMAEIKRFAIAGGISLWFSSDPKGSFRVVAPDYPTLQALQWAVSSSFGSLCFSALVSNLCEAIKWCVRVVEADGSGGGGEEDGAGKADASRQHTPRGPYLDALPRSASPRPDSAESDKSGGEEASVEGTPWSLSEVVGFVNRFATPMMAHSGYPFCHACKVTSLLMKRNFLEHIIDDRSPELVLRIGALVVASWSGVAGMFLSEAYVEWAVVDQSQLHVIHKLVARFVLSASFAISLLVLNFLASMLLDAMDALLLLYAMDRDNRTMQPRGAVLHELLAAQQVGRAQPGLLNYTPRGWNYVRASLSARRSTRSLWRDQQHRDQQQGSTKTLGQTGSAPPSPVREEREREERGEDASPHGSQTIPPLAPPPPSEATQGSAARAHEGEAAQQQASSP